MIAIRVYLRTYTNGNSGIVWIIFYLNRAKNTISTRVYVENKNWSVNKQRTKPMNSNFHSSTISSKNRTPQNRPNEPL